MKLSDEKGEKSPEISAVGSKSTQSTVRNSTKQTARGETNDVLSPSRQVAK